MSDKPEDWTPLGEALKDGPFAGWTVEKRHLTREQAESAIAEADKLPTGNYARIDPNITIGSSPLQEYVRDVAELVKAAREAEDTLRMEGYPSSAYALEKALKPFTRAASGSESS